MFISNIFTGLTKSEIVAQSVLFFIAGFATTSDTMMWLCYELAVNSDIQDKMIQEVDEVTKGVIIIVFLKNTTAVELVLRSPLGLAATGCIRGMAF